MISRRVTAEDRVVGLEHGADDYIAKPFHMREVVLRVCRALDRYGPAEALPGATTNSGESERYRIEAGVLDVSRRELKSAGGALHLIKHVLCDSIGL